MSKQHSPLEKRARQQGGLAGHKVKAKLTTRRSTRTRRRTNNSSTAWLDRPPGSRAAAGRPRALPGRPGAAGGPAGRPSGAAEGGNSCRLAGDRRTGTPSAWVVMMSVREDKTYGLRGLGVTAAAAAAAVAWLRLLLVASGVVVFLAGHCAGRDMVRDECGVMSDRGEASRRGSALRGGSNMYKRELS